MARTNNLTNFLIDVSSAIKQKTGDNTPIPASEFDTEILSIETGGNYQSKTLNITQNGNYNLLPDTGYDAMDQVAISVDVPTEEPVLQTKSIIENGTYTPDEGYDGFSQVDVNVDSIPEGIFIQENTPTKTTVEAMWIKDVNVGEVTISTDNLPDTVLNWKAGNGYTVRNAINNMTAEQKAIFNSYPHHVIIVNTAWNGTSYLVGCQKLTSLRPIGSSSTLYTTYFEGPYCMYSWTKNAYNGFSTSTKTSGSASTDFSVTTRISDDYVTDGTRTIEDNASVYIHEPEDGLNVVVNDKQYIINISKMQGAGWSKILDTSNANATANNILSGKTAFVNNQKVTGTMPNNGAINITPSTSQQTIPAGYTSGGTISAVTSTIDSNIQAENIKKDIEILGVTGTYEGSGTDPEYETNLDLTYQILGISPE